MSNVQLSLTETGETKASEYSNNVLIQDVLPQ